MSFDMLSYPHSSEFYAVNEQFPQMSIEYATIDVRLASAFQCAGVILIVLGEKYGELPYGVGYIFIAHVELVGVAFGIE